MPTPETIIKTGNGRVWVQPDGTNTAFEFLTNYGATNVTEPAGALTPVYEPSRAQWNKYQVVDIVEGQPGLVTFSVETLLTNVLSFLRTIKCPTHIQFRLGLCDRPDNPHAWDRIMHFYRARRGNWSSATVISRDGSNAAPVAEAADWSAEELLDLVPVTPARVSVSETQNAVSVAISKVANCPGVCGPIEEVCDTVVVGTDQSAYGSASNVLLSTDGGATFTATSADPFAAGHAVIAVIILGDRIIAVNGDAPTPTIAYSDDNGATWTTTTSAEGAVGDLNDGFAVDWAHVYFCGNGGFIFISTDGGQTLTTQADGTATVENLNKIRVLPNLTGYAVGDNDTVLKTTDGTTWAVADADPGSGDHLIALWVVDENRVWVGTSGGQLFYTDDGAATWTERTFSGSGAGEVHAIEFFNEAHGYMLHETAAGVGRTFRTIDGGYDWTMNTGGIDATPTNSGLNALAVCGVNALFAVGDAHGGTAFIVKVD